MQFKHSNLTLTVSLISALVLGACNTGEVSNPPPGESDASQQADGELLDDATPAADISGAVDTATQEDTVTPDDATAPADSATQEDTVTPGDATAPADSATQEDTVTPGDATAPADSTLPEDATDPEDASSLADTAAPEDAAVPEDTAAPEDAAVPEDTAPADAEPEGLGTAPTSCGAIDQGLTPIDCTKYGDSGAGCVFSNHCSCSANDGFVCEGWKEGDGVECLPGIYCVPKAEPVDPQSVGNVPTSCGSPDPIDCTQYGDSKAICVFGHHCMCSVEDGFTCASPGEFGGDKECDPGVYCMPVD
jgi:hypothetical protein